MSFKLFDLQNGTDTISISTSELCKTHCIGQIMRRNLN